MGAAALPRGRRDGRLDRGRAVRVRLRADPDARRTGCPTTGSSGSSGWRSSRAGCGAATCSATRSSCGGCSRSGGAGAEPAAGHRARPPPPPPCSRFCSPPPPGCPHGPGRRHPRHRAGRRCGRRSPTVLPVRRLRLRRDAAAPPGARARSTSSSGRSATGACVAALTLTVPRLRLRARSSSRSRSRSRPGSRCRWSRCGAPRWKAAAGPAGGVAALRRRAARRSRAAPVLRGRLSDGHRRRLRRVPRRRGRRVPPAQPPDRGQRRTRRSTRCRRSGAPSSRSTTSLGADGDAVGARALRGARARSRRSCSRSLRSGCSCSRAALLGADRALRACSRWRSPASTRWCSRPCCTPTSTRPGATSRSCSRCRSRGGPCATAIEAPSRCLALFMLLGALAYPLALPIPALALIVFFALDLRERRRRGDRPACRAAAALWRGGRGLAGWCRLAVAARDPGAASADKAWDAARLLLDPNSSLRGWAGDILQFIPAHEFFGLADGHAVVARRRGHGRCSPSGS